MASARPACAQLPFGNRAAQPFRLALGERVAGAGAGDDCRCTDQLPDSAVRVREPQISTPRLSALLSTHLFSLLYPGLE